MKRTHLGDSIDIWKRGLIGYLRDTGAIGRVEVVPMMTDARPRKQDELTAYARVQGVSVSDLLGTGRFTQSGRSQYFVD
jgi:hypothetical protein